jgi:hypothetical protein
MKPAFFLTSVVILLMPFKCRTKLICAAYNPSVSSFFNILFQTRSSCDVSSYFGCPTENPRGTP